jgi:hypothetical protein
VEDWVVAMADVVWIREDLLLHHALLHLGYKVWNTAETVLCSGLVVKGNSLVVVVADSGWENDFDCLQDCNHCKYNVFSRFNPTMWDHMTYQCILHYLVLINE